MPKTIKFNLNCDGASIRTIEDLREHFCIQDVLDYYKKGILARWLKVHGYNAELGKLEKISSEDDAEIISEIIQILDVEQDEKIIKEGVALIEFQKERECFYNKISKGIEVERDFLDLYRNGYEEVIERIVQNKNDYSIIKSATKTLADNYMWLLKFDFKRLFCYLQEKAPVALFGFLANEKMRVFCKSDQNSDNYKHFCKTITSQYLEENLGNSLKKYKRNTDEYWKDLEPENKKCLLLLIENRYYNVSCLVRSSGKHGEELTCKDINNNFILLDGIDFKNNREDVLYYMEV